MSFIPFGTDDAVVSSQAITAALWTGNAYNLSGSFYTSSAQETSTSGKTYLNVYNLPFITSGSETQFSIAYGHVSGSGSGVFNSTVDEKSPTRDVYGQFRNLVYGDETVQFNFGGSNGISKDIFVINVNRARYKQSINAGTWGLKLTNGTASINLTDDSNSASTVNYLGGNRVYNIVSGNLGYANTTSSIQTNSGSYGLFFPDMGIFVLNPRALALSYNGQNGIGLTTDETAATTYSVSYNTNNQKLFGAINSGSGNFYAKSQETVSSTYFFVNAKSSQLNYTTNPSIIDNNGNVLYSVLINDPQPYPTTIGLYNDAGELLAVAKLSKPLAKDFTKQLTCRVKLEF
jgi:hypothetical protein